MNTISSCPAITALLITVSISILPDSARADVWDVFSKDLRVARTHSEQCQFQYEQMGLLQLRQTVPHVGAQLHMKTEPPPQSPWIQLDLGEVQTFDRILIVPAIIGVAKDEFEPYAFPERLRVDVSESKEFDSFKLVYDSDKDDLDPRSPFPLVIDTPGASSRYVRITVTGLARVTNRWTFALSEVMVIEGNRNIALNSEVTMADTAIIPPIWGKDYLVDGQTPLGPPIVSPDLEQSLPRFDGVFFLPKDGGESWFQIDLQEVAEVDAVRLFPVHARQGADYPGYAFPLRFRIEGATDSSFHQPETLFETERDFENPGNNPVMIEFPEFAARYIRVTSEKGSLPETTKVGFAEAQVLSGDENLANGKPVTAKNWRDDRPLSLLVDGEASYGRIVSLGQWTDQWKLARELRREIQSANRNIESLTVKAKRRATLIGAGVALFSCLAAFAFSWQRRRALNQRQSDFRMRLAQDLHDEIGSNLAAIARIGEVGESVVEDESLKKDWQSVRELAGECTESVQETLWLLGGPKRQGENIADRLRSVGNRMLTGVELDWDFDPEFDSVQLDEKSEREIVLVFKALMANIARSSGATKVEVRASKQNRSWLVQVQDNGKGFDAARWAEKMESRGMGLESMESRMRKLGGSLKVESEPGQGTQISIEIAPSSQNKL